MVERRDGQRSAQTVSRAGKSSAEIHTRRPRRPRDDQDPANARARRDAGRESARRATPDGPADEDRTGTGRTTSRGSGARRNGRPAERRPRRAATTDLKTGTPKPRTPKPRTRETSATPADAQPSAVRAFAASVRRRAPGALSAIPATSIGRTLVALVTVVVLILTGWAWSRVNSLTAAINRADLGLGGASDGATDILLVGTDSRIDARGNPMTEDELKWLRVGDETTSSTDTILLIRIPNDGSQATAISIPRDSYVAVPDIGMSKINAAYGATREAVRRTEVENGASEQAAEAAGTKAGRKALIQSVSDLTGVTVDHYAEVGLLGFALLTDAVGGVEVCLNNPVNEPKSGARFKAGRQKLDGPQALSFVRQRQDLPRGDLDRITRQQVFMASLAQQILSSGTLTDTSKLTSLETAISRSVLIDDGWDIFGFAEQLSGLSGGNVKFATIPVITEHGWSEDGMQSVVEVDPEQVRTYVDRQLAPGQQREGRGKYTVDVVNAGTVDGLAANVSGLLTASGYQEGSVASEPINEFDSLVFARNPDSEGAKQLARDLGGVAIREDSSLPENTLRAVLTNTFSGDGSIWNTGHQQLPAESGADAAPEQPAASGASRAIKADGDGPVCVN